MISRTRFITVSYGYFYLHKVWISAIADRVEYTNSRPNLKIVRQLNLDTKILLHWAVSALDVHNDVDHFGSSLQQKGLAVCPTVDLFIFSVLVCFNSVIGAQLRPERCNMMWVSNSIRSHSQLLPGWLYSTSTGSCLCPDTQQHRCLHTNRNVKKRRKHMEANFTSWFEV